MFDKLTSGTLPLRVERAKFPVDGENDYALVAEINGKWYVIAEFFGRCSAEVRLPAEQNANYVLSLFQSHGASVPHPGEVNSNANG